MRLKALNKISIMCTFYVVDDARIFSKGLRIFLTLGQFFGSLLLILLLQYIMMAAVLSVLWFDIAL
jgi:hypothetical protein